MLQTFCCPWRYKTQAQNQSTLPLNTSTLSGTGTNYGKRLVISPSNANLVTVVQTLATFLVAALVGFIICTISSQDVGSC